MQADDGYTPLKLNEKNVENKARRYEYLGGKQPYMGNSQRILPGGGGETESEITATPGITNQI
jgi:hypothetical protein